MSTDDNGPAGVLGSHDRRRFLKAAGATAGLASFAGCTGSVGGGTSFPSRTMTFICAYGPGSSADVELRKIAEIMAQEYDVDIAVENVVGAGSLRAVGELFNRSADGHTVCQIYIPSYIVTVHTQEPGWDPRDLTGIGTYSTYQTCITTHEDYGVENFEDLFQMYRDGELSKVGGLGRGHSWHLQFALLRNEFDFPWETFVNYDEGSELIRKAVIQKEVGAGLDSVNNAVPAHRSDESPLQIVGTTASPHPLYPDIPSWTEDFDRPSIDWIAKFTINIIAPPGVPDDAVNKLEEMFETTVLSDEMQAFGEQSTQYYDWINNSEELEELTEETYNLIPEKVNLDEMNI